MKRAFLKDLKPELAKLNKSRDDLLKSVIEAQAGLTRYTRKFYFQKDGFTQASGKTEHMVKLTGGAESVANDFQNFLKDNNIK